MSVVAMIDHLDNWFAARWPPTVPFDRATWTNALTVTARVEYTEAELVAVCDGWLIGRAPFPSEIAHALSRSRERARVKLLVGETKRRLADARRRADESSIDGKNLLTVVG